MSDESFDLTNYIKKELDRKDAYYQNKCLKNIGNAFNEYLSYDNLLKNMDDNSIRELEDAIDRVKFQRKSFTKFITCSREEADKEAINLRSKGYFTYGEFGGEYGYFQHKKELTEEQKEWFVEHKECCYYHGQPCWVWQKEEADDWDEDCECRLGRDLSSLSVYELDEEEEKSLGVWKQDFIWRLNGYDNNFDNYYSLDQLKNDALEDCDHKLKEDNKNCQVCVNLLAYDGTKTFNQGNIKIKILRDDENSD